MTHDEVTKLMDAYLDGELDLTTCVNVEEHLAGCIACQQKMEGEQELVELVRTEMPRFDAPFGLETRIRAQVREQQGGGAAREVARRGWIGWVGWVLSGSALAAVVVWLSVAGFSSGVPEVVSEAVSSHIRSLQASHLMDVASTDQHTVKPWFAGKLAFSPQVIDLGPSGYPLVGGRLDVLQGQDVAAVIYGRRKHFINLFIWPAAPHVIADHAYAESGYHVLTWSASGMNYAAVSEIGENELQEFAGLIQQGGKSPGPER